MRAQRGDPVVGEHVTGEPELGLRLAKERVREQRDLLQLRN